MRIIVLGDFHLEPDSIDLTRMAMEDVAACRPDLIVPLGDFGSPDKIGTVAGLYEAEAFLNSLPAAIHPILGNHDLEWESGENTQKKGTMAAELVRLFKLSGVYRTLEYDAFRLFFITSEPQPDGSCFSLQECYISDQQFSWIEHELKRRPGIPAVLFSHAPPAGSGIRTASHELHVKSTNAYLDQNHDLFRWSQLMKHYSEIRLWFSAHFHLGHHYPDSQTVRFGTYFFNTGVHGACTRDNTRVSRVIDVESDRFQVQTLDHRKRSIVSEDLTIIKGRHQTTKYFPCAQDQVPGVTLASSCPVGVQRAVVDGVSFIDEGHCLVNSNDGYCWEVRSDLEAVLGSLYCGPGLQASVLCQDKYWVTWGQFLAVIDLHDPWRFAREKNICWPKERLHFHAPIKKLAKHPENGVWAATTKHLYWIKIEELLEQATPVCLLPASPRHMVLDQNVLWLLDEEARLWCFNEGCGWVQKLEDVISFDVLNGLLVVLQLRNGKGRIVKIDPGSDIQAVLAFFPDMKLSLMKNVRILCLHAGKWLVIWDQEIYFSGPHLSKPVKLSSPNGNAVTMDRFYQHFAVCREGGEMDERPYLEVYNYRL